MKCDKLQQVENPIEWGLYYDKNEVEAAIAELKEIANDACLERDDNQKVIDELEAENQRLVKCCKEYDSRQRIDERIKANASKQLRATKRALWLARAYFCARSCEYFNGIMSHCLIGQDDLYERCEKRKNKYLKAMYKCRAKAEEYK